MLSSTVRSTPEGYYTASMLQGYSLAPCKETRTNDLCTPRPKGEERTKARACFAARTNLESADRENFRLSADVDQHLNLMENRFAWLLEGQGRVHDGLTRRPLAREEYASENAQVLSSSDPPRAAEVNSAAVGAEENALASSSRVVASGPLEAVESEEAVITPPPSVGSTPPPSYPGTPESGASHESSLWETLSDEQEAVNSASSLPGDLSTSEQPAHPSDHVEETHDALNELVEETHDKDRLAGTVSDADAVVAEDHVVSWFTVDTVACGFGALPDAGPGRLSVLKDADHDPVLGEPPRMISRAIYTFGDIDTEYVSTFLRADGSSGGIEVVVWHAVWVLGASRSPPGTLRPLFRFWGHRGRLLASFDLCLGPGGIEVVVWHAATSVWVLGATRSSPGKLRPLFGFWGIEIIAWQASTSVWVLGASRSSPGTLRPLFGFWGNRGRRLASFDLCLGSGGQIEIWTGQSQILSGQLRYHGNNLANCLHDGSGRLWAVWPT
ncbi:hypothetical protein B0H11DRAFT_1905273 [Mycena galericulata]|nr:hypothetical protein B0H11DRAFT_1905273 [Mycena galericulata]